MTNTINFNDKRMQAATVAAMKELMASNDEQKTMTELYEEACKYADVTREQFEELFKQAKEKFASWECDLEANHELAEDELDMVVGGSAWDWIKDHKAQIAMVAIGTICAIGIGAMTGGALAGMGALLVTSAYSSSAVTVGAVVGGVVGGCAGLGWGLYEANK